jgi:altronate dehydratase
MNDHIPDPTKMISDTPRMQSALLDHPNAGFAIVWRVGCDIERELNAANAIIRQQQLLDEENLRLQERIKRLEEAEDVIKASLQRSLNSNEQGECKWLAELPMTDAEFAVFTTAFKAKEAKP